MIHSIHPMLELSAECLDTLGRGHVIVIFKGVNQNCCFAIDKNSEKKTNPNHVTDVVDLCAI